MFLRPFLRHTMPRGGRQARSNRVFVPISTCKKARTPIGGARRERRFSAQSCERNRCWHRARADLQTRPGAALANYRCARSYPDTGRARVPSWGGGYTVTLLHVCSRAAPVGLMSVSGGTDHYPT